MNNIETLKEALELSRLLLKRASESNDLKREHELNMLISVIKDSILEQYEDSSIYNRRK